MSGFEYFQQFFEYDSALYTGITILKKGIFFSISLIFPSIFRAFWSLSDIFHHL